MKRKVIGMKRLLIPEGYTSPLGIKETEVAIKELKDFFERELAKQLNLTRVSAPLFVKPETGLNDNLNGVERPVSFGIKEQGDAIAEIVHSLAKWKRFALKRYDFQHGEGLYTDMNAVRRDEDTDNLHSLFVDQWDWEKIISKEERNFDTLKATVRSIYEALKNTEDFISKKYDYVKKILPDEISFITTQELEDMYPTLSPRDRETEIVRLKGAVFIMQIGGALKSGEKHDGRAPDYDDWKLNGDIVVYYPLFDSAFELSSMGIRVDEEALKEQLKISGCPERAELPFQKALLKAELPYTIGGGIGQSRICMFFLRKAHIGEVQSSIWPDDVVEEAKSNGINLL
jgi:aspartate--ammonia ligase